MVRSSLSDGNSRERERERDGEGEEREMERGKREGGKREAHHCKFPFVTGEKTS